MCTPRLMFAGIYPTVYGRWPPDWPGLAGFFEGEAGTAGVAGVAGVAAPPPVPGVARVAGTARVAGVTGRLSVPTTEPRIWVARCWDTFDLAVSEAS